MNLGSISDKVSQINGLERKYTSLIKNPLSLLSPTKFGFLSQSVLTKMKGRSDPVLAIDWDVQLPKVSTKSLGGEYVERVSLVFPAFEVREVYQRGVMAKYPGATRQIDNLVLSFYADINNKAFEYVNLWHHMVGQRGEFGRAGMSTSSAMSGYKMPIVVLVKDMYQQDLIRLEYQKCWPINIDGVELVGDSSERLTWNVSFAVEDIVISGYNLDTLTGSIMNLVSGTISSIMGSVTDAVTKVGNSLFDTASNAFMNSSIGQSISGVVGNVKSTVSGAVDSVANSVTSFIDSF